MSENLTTQKIDEMCKIQTIVHGAEEGKYNLKLPIETLSGEDIYDNIY